MINRSKLWPMAQFVAAILIAPPVWAGSTFDEQPSADIVAATQQPSQLARNVRFSPIVFPRGILGRLNDVSASGTPQMTLYFERAKMPKGSQGNMFERNSSEEKLTARFD